MHCLIESKGRSGIQYRPADFFLNSGLNKAVLSVRKQLMQQLPEGRFGPTKYNNIGTFKRIIVYEY